MTIKGPILIAWGIASTLSAGSVARDWNEENLAAIRIDFPNPAVHSRNLFHSSVAMWDAWAAYDPVAVGYAHNEVATAGNVEAAREEAISYAAYRVLSARYASSVNAVTTQAALEARMGTLGYDFNIVTTTGDTPAALGNRVAAAILGFSASDGSRETTEYDDPTYLPVNKPLIFAEQDGFQGVNDEFGDPTPFNPNRWQPLAFDFALTQNGLVADDVQTFLGSHWGVVRPFALRSVPGEDTFLDPGLPPQLNGVGHSDYLEANLQVLRFSSYLDPDDGVTVDISPGAIGNNVLGTNSGTGYSINPMTGWPYAPKVVKRADYGRVVAEFWADGPASETPPGHWNTLANEVVDEPIFERRFQGYGPELPDLEWDVKMYFVLNAAVHDAAVAAWGCKRKYDYLRPISSIRYLDFVGLLPEDSPGTPAGSELVEVITSTSVSEGRHAHLSSYLGQRAVRTWQGEPADPATEYSGVGWILAQEWLPYQRDTFVTPAFAGYVSGHSCFSRAAAEVLTRLTGSAFFPGGLKTHTELAGSLDFELGPSADVELQWATYYDAADQAGISRLYGGIHVAADDGPGRIMGAACGIAAWDEAMKYFDGTVLSEPLELAVARTPGGDLELTWGQSPGLWYQVTSGSEGTFPTATGWTQAGDPTGVLAVPAPTGGQLYRVERVAEMP